MQTDKATIDSTHHFSAEAEQQVLGSLLLENEHLATVQGMGGAGLFFDPVHRDLYQRIAECYRHDMLASPVSLQVWAMGHEGLKQLGGMNYLARLVASSIAPSQIASYCEILDDLRRKRRLAEVMGAINQDLLAGEQTADQIAARVEMAVAEIEPNKATAPVLMGSAIKDALMRVVDASNGVDTGGVRTGVGALDRLLTPMSPGELILLGGRPSMGKTALAISMAVNAARGGRKVGFASYEMTPDAVGLRVLSEHMSEAGHGIAYRALREGDLQESDRQWLESAAHAASDLPIAFVGREYQDAGSLLAAARRIRSILSGLDLLVVDYVQLMRAQAAKGRYETITEISTALKHLAVKLNIPVLALSQLSRQVEQREDKRPQLADLRESGQLEQDADAVLFVYRDEYYLERMDTSKMSDDQFAKHEEALMKSRKMMEVAVAKQRQGPTGVAKIGCAIEMNRVFDL